MIRLFRKIRRQLLSEDKYSIYLLYAAGEILLVVIGIMLALQLDNWNDKRKEKVEIQVLMKALHADLAKDTLSIENQLTLVINDTMKLHSFEQSMSSEQVTLDTLIQIARYDFDPWLYVNIAFNRNTFSSLLSTGKIGLLDPWLQNDLLELNEMHQLYRQTIDVDVSIYLHRIMLYNQKFPFNDQGHIEADSHLSDLIWRDVQLKELAIDLNSIVALKYVTTVPGLHQLSTILKKSEEILGKIDHIETAN